MGLILVFSGIRKYYLYYANYQNNGYKLSSTTEFVYNNTYIYILPILGSSVIGFFLYLDKPNVINTIMISLPLIIYFAIAINVKNNTKRLEINQAVKRFIAIDILIFIATTVALVLIFKAKGFFIAPILFVGASELFWVIKYPFYKLVKRQISNKIYRNLTNSKVDIILFDGTYGNLILKHLYNLIQKQNNVLIGNKKHRSEFAYLLSLNYELSSYDYLFLEVTPYNENLFQDLSTIKKVINDDIFNDLSVNNYYYTIKNQDYHQSELLITTPSKNYDLAINLGDKLSFDLLLVALLVADKLSLIIDINNLKGISGYASISNPDGMFIINASNFDTKKAYESHLDLIMTYNFSKIFITNADMNYLTDVISFNVNEFDLIYLIDEKVASKTNSKEYLSFADLDLILKPTLADAIEEINAQKLVQKPLVVLIENIKI